MMTSNSMLDLSLVFAAHFTGRPIDLGVLELVPILCQDDGLDADLLEEALRGERAHVAEVSEAGCVSAVRLAYRGARPLLIVDGEEIVGAKQNRVFNASFLVPSGTVVDLPVSCVERGRWSHATPAFHASGRTLTCTARSAKLRRVVGSVGAGRGYDADQQTVWRDVDTYLEHTRVVSRTASLADAMEVRATGVQRCVAAIPLAPDQVGFAAVRGDGLVGMDIFGSPSLFRRAWPKIASGLLAEVFSGPSRRGGGASVALRALAAAAHAPQLRQAAPGCGETIVAQADGFTMGAIAYGDELYHAFISGG